jgi:ribosomal-protein-alanine N-acetyltransferase
MIALVGAEAAVALAALHARAFDRSWSASEISTMLANPNTFALLASGDAPQGFAIAWAVAGEAELLTVAVAPEARRLGVGATLLLGIIEAARRHGARRLHLEVADDNTGAIALYRKLGFADISRRRGYYRRADREPADALVMNLSLMGP